MEALQCATYQTNNIAQEITSFISKQSGAREMFQKELLQIHLFGSLVKNIYTL